MVQILALKPGILSGFFVVFFTIWRQIPGWFLTFIHAMAAFFHVCTVHSSQIAHFGIAQSELLECVRNETINNAL